MKNAFRSYVAIGDSLSEGLGDSGFSVDRRQCGWTDRLAGLLSMQAKRQSVEFKYANLAIRGSKMADILGNQLDQALALKPDLVTIMAGANDFMSSPEKLVQMDQQFRLSLARLTSAGIQVLVANTISPTHLRVFKPLTKKSLVVTQMIESAAADFGVPVLDVHRIEHLQDLNYWAKDMVHFSEHGHIKVANKAAAQLGLDYRVTEVAHDELEEVRRSMLETLAWITRDVIPFFKRRITGVSSGRGITAKYPSLIDFEPAAVQQLEFTGSSSTSALAA